MSGFLGSPPFIYKQLKWHGKAKQVVEKDIISKLANMENAGFWWDGTKGKLCTPQDRHMWVHSTPWIHQQHGASKRCGLDHQICFNLFGIIPPKCLECWKVVVNPRNFRELVALRDLQIEQNVASKCGIELRDYTPRHYGGYYYNDSFDEGRDKYEMVRKDVDEAISPEVPVILKRACTEFEMVKGPSPLWHMTPAEEKTLGLIENYVEYANINHKQSDEIKNHVILKWILWAHSNGDMTYKDWNNGESIFPAMKTFHEEDREKVKQELAIAKANALNGMKGEDATKLLGAVFQAATENKLDANAVFNMGGNTQNVLNFKPLEEVPDETKGDQDELT